MKSLALILLVAVAGASAAFVPQNDVEARQERIVTDVIVAAIDAVSRQIQEAGLDPLVVDRAEVRYVLLPLLVQASAFVQNLKFTGASNIAVNQMNYSLLTSRLRFDVSLPELSLTVGDSGAHLLLFGTNLNAEANGSLQVRQPRLAGNVQVSVGIISGISVRDLELDVSLGGIESALRLVIQGRDFSQELNEALNDTIPNFLEVNRSQINAALEQIVWEIIDQLL